MPGVVNIGGAIYAQRVRMGMSQRALGAAVGVTPQMIQKYESGECRISVDQLIRIANAFGVGAGALINDINSRQMYDATTCEIINAVCKMDDSDRKLIHRIVHRIVK